jgi:hypothetical protein
VPFFVILLFELGAPEAAPDDVPVADRLGVPDPVSATAES